MAYKALYRTYRPQTFEEVAGQTHIVKTLKNALENNKIAHAYLFCGPRGTGKTTMAKLLAKALNCECGMGHQCNECNSCVEIMNGTHPDVIEIDAASNNGVEQARDLINTVNYLPLEGKYKVYIIDEVHMMTTSAFNALLKTLEEPPAHVVFILATTEPHNIIPTILSRCQRYDFTKVNDGDIAGRLVTVLKQEGIEYDDGAVDAIVSLADGGMRDALSILDQVLAYSGNTLNEDDVYMLFGLTSKADKIDFLKSLVQGNAARCLELINNYFQGGVDLKRLNSDLLNILKDVLILKVTNEENEMSILSEKEANDLGKYLSVKTTNEMISSLLKTQSDFKSVDNIKTLFEITILKLCSLGMEQEPVKETVRYVDKPRVQPQPVVTPKPAPVEETKVVETPAPKVEEEVKEEPKAASVPAWLVSDGNKYEIATEGEQYSLDDDTIVRLMIRGDKNLRTGITDKWGQLGDLVTNKKYGDVAFLLRDASPVVATKDVLVISYPHERIVKRNNIKDNQQAIRDLINKMTGLDMFVYAVSNSEKVRLIMQYTNLRQINRLPDPKELDNINFKEMK